MARLDAHAHAFSGERDEGMELTTPAHVFFGEPGEEEWWEEWMEPTSPTREAQVIAQEILCNAEIALEIAVKDVEKGREGMFSRVLGTDFSSGNVFFSSQVDEPNQQSPSFPLKVFPQNLEIAIRSTMRFQTLTQGSLHCASAFALSPTLLATNSHVAINGCPLRCMGEASMLPKQFFDMGCKSRYHLDIVRRRRDADFALLRVSNSENVFPHPPSPHLHGRFSSFLLPCSPKYPGNVATISFPGIYEFLLRARAELIDDANIGQMSIWQIYKNSMREELKEKMRMLQPTYGNATKEIAKRVVKRLLFRRFQETFGPYTSGSMVASVGRMHKESDGIALTTCSTLHGSSGGPVCPYNKQGYVWGVHRGSTIDISFNDAVTFDNLDVVEDYFNYVLDDLPRPNDEFWSDWDLVPFYRWLVKHESNQQFPLGEWQTLWLKVAHAELKKRRRSMPMVHHAMPASKCMRLLDMMKNTRA